MGVRIVQLTSNTRNLLGEGHLERTDAGLSRFGIEAVERMNELAILVDVSHSGELTSLEGIEFSEKPVAIDHAVNVAGIEHVGIRSDREHQRIPDTPEEVERLREEISRLGPAAAARFRWPFFLSELNHPRRMETVAEGLARRGWTEREIDFILGGNFLRLFEETIG